MPTSITILSGSFVRANWAGKYRLAAHSDKNDTPKVIGFHKGIALSSMTGIGGDSPMGQHLQMYVTKSLNEGFPSAPSLEMTQPTSWRFRWSVKAGPRAVYVWASQNSTGSFRPSMVVRSNSEVGLNADISASAPDGAGWQQIGPINFTATGNGMVWVELHNNNYAHASASYFDHIITT